MIDSVVIGDAAVLSAELDSVVVLLESEPPVTPPGTDLTGRVIRYEVPADSRVYMVPIEGTAPVIKRFNIRNGERLDYCFYFRRWFEETDADDALLSAVVTKDGDSFLELESQTYQALDTVCEIITVNGAAVGTEYTISCLMTSVEGRKKRASFVLVVVDQETPKVQHLMQPTEIIDLDFDFAEWFAKTASADSLPASVSASGVIREAASDQDPPILAFAAKTHPGLSVVKQVIRLGTNGLEYKITCTITTTNGLIKVAEVFVLVIEL